MTTTLHNDLRDVIQRIQDAASDSPYLDGKATDRQLPASALKMLGGSMGFIEGAAFSMNPASLPPVPGDAASDGIVVTGNPGGAAGSELPTLAPANSLGPLSLDSLMQALGFETSRLLTRSGLEALDAKAQERRENFAKQMDELQKQLADMKKQDKLGVFAKIFKVIGMVVGAIAAAATLAAGAATGNPLLIAGGVVLTTMAINAVVSQATDGKVSIGAGFAALAKEFGASEKVAQIVGAVSEVVIALIGVALTLGAGSASTGASAASMGAKFINLCSKFSAMAQGLNQVAQSGIGIGMAIVTYDIEMSKADQKMLQALLDRLQAAYEMSLDYLEAQMTREAALMEDIKNLVGENNRATGEILGAQAAPA